MHERRPRAKHTADLTNGPGKLCAALGITGAMNGLSLRRKPIVIREGEPVADRDIEVTTRIGIAPERCADWPLRWIVKDNRFVSHQARPKKS
jgi:DNA-3-methyladenine glycosylase